MFAVCHKENSQLQNDCQIQNDFFSSLKIFVSSFSPLICLQGRMVSSTQHKHREKKIKIGSQSHCRIILRWTEEIEKTRSRRNLLKLFAVKPLLVIYMMSWAVTSSVTTQFWLFRTCRNYYNQTGIIVSG